MSKGGSRNRETWLDFLCLSVSPDMAAIQCRSKAKSVRHEDLRCAEASTQTTEGSDPQTINYMHMHVRRSALHISSDSQLHLAAKHSFGITVQGAPTAT